MRTPDPRFVTEVIYNPETDMYELFSFGTRVRRSPDAALVDSTAYYIERAYREGRDNTLSILNSGEATLEELNETSRMMRVLKSSNQPGFEDAMTEQDTHNKYVDLRDLAVPDFKDEPGF